MRIMITFGSLSIPITNDFTALHVHGMQTRYSDEKGVRLSVRLSVCLSVCQTLAL